MQRLLSKLLSSKNKINFLFHHVVKIADINERLRQKPTQQKLDKGSQRHAIVNSIRRVC